MLTQHIRESLQVWPGHFPDFLVGPGDEARDEGPESSTDSYCILIIRTKWTSFTLLKTGEVYHTKTKLVSASDFLLYCGEQVWSAGTRNKRLASSNGQQDFFGHCPYCGITMISTTSKHHCICCDVLIVWKTTRMGSSKHGYTETVDICAWAHGQSA